MNNEARSFFGERPLPPIEVDPQLLRRRTRRDVLLLGAGTVAALAGARSLLPHALRIDDDVAELLYSPHRTVRTYTKSQMYLFTALRPRNSGAPVGRPPESCWLAA